MSNHVHLLFRLYLAILKLITGINIHSTTKILPRCSPDSYLRVKYYYTKDGGKRVYNPKVFKYNRPKYTGLDKLLIDTSAGYVLDSLYAHGRELWEFSSQALQFSSAGQLLFIN
jgi:hypothetical protein